MKPATPYKIATVLLAATTLALAFREVARGPAIGPPPPDTAGGDLTFPSELPLRASDASTGGDASEAVSQDPAPTASPTIDGPPPLAGEVRG